jgi:hypothetical protein
MEHISKVKLVAALRQLKEAHENLNAAWVEKSDTDLNDTESIRFYPFHRSFDELKVTTWCDETIKELVGDLPENLTMLNPECIQCGHCIEVNIMGISKFECIADGGNEGCEEVYIPYDREKIITAIVECIKLSTKFKFESIDIILREGNAGFNHLTDYELLAVYSDLIKRK